MTAAAAMAIRPMTIRPISRTGIWTNLPHAAGPGKGVRSTGLIRHGQQPATAAEGKPPPWQRGQAWSKRSPGVCGLASLGAGSLLFRRVLLPVRKYSLQDHRYDAPRKTATL